MIAPLFIAILTLAHAPASFAEELGTPTTEPEAISQALVEEGALCSEADTAKLIVVSLKKRRQIQTSCRLMDLQIEEALAIGPRESCDLTQLRYLRHARKICRKNGA